MSPGIVEVVSVRHPWVPTREIEDGRIETVSRGIEMDTSLEEGLKIRRSTFFG